MVGHKAVTLSWRVFSRSLHESSGGVWMVVAVALLAATSMGQSSAQMGDALARNEIPRSHAPLILGLWLWATFMGTFAYALAVGELSFIRALLTDLATRPLSHWQAFLAVQAVTTGGPHSLALLSVGLPWLVLLSTWRQGTALLAAVAATFVLLRLPVSLLLIGSRVLSTSPARAALTVGSAGMVVAVLWLTAPDQLTASSPPGLVVRILMDDAALRAWVGLAVWTFALAAIEFWTARIEAAPRAAPVTTARPLPPLPAFPVFLARLAGCQAALLHGELLRLIRWRRYQLSWLMGGVLCALVGSRLIESPGLIYPLAFSLVPAHVGTSVLANLFTTDRAAFHAFLMAPAGMRAVVRSKIVAVLLFTLVAQAAGSAYLLAHGVSWPFVTAGVVLAAGLFMWAAASGLLTSVVFPSPSDPYTVGGALVTTPAVLVIAAGSSLYWGASLYLAYALQTGRWTSSTCAFAALALVGAAAAALAAVSRLAPRLIATRQEAMLQALSAGVRA